MKACRNARCMLVYSPPSSPSISSLDMIYEIHCLRGNMRVWVSIGLMILQ
jgi:hypothetical protein